mgnify:CR=1 FL=1
MLFRSDVAQARDERARLKAQHRVTLAGLDRDLLSLQQEAVQRRGARVTLLKAPMQDASRLAFMYGVQGYAYGMLELATGSYRGVLHVAGEDTVSRHEFGAMLLRYHGRDASRLPGAKSLSTKMPSRIQFWR